MIRVSLLVFVFFILTPLFACQADKKDSTTMHTKNINIQTDLTSLKRLMTLPAEPVSVKWSNANLVENIGQSPGPNDWGLLALLEYETPIVNELLAKQITLKAASIPTTLPLAELVDAHRHFKIDGNKPYFVFEGEAKEATLFFKEPLLRGAVFLLDEHNMLVYLHTQ